jgi:hypothetical protein
MFKYNKYNTFYFYNINYLLKLSLNYSNYYNRKKLNYLKKFKNMFRHLLYVNTYVYKFNFFIYFFKNQLKNSFNLNIISLNFSSFKSLRNLCFF